MRKNLRDRLRVAVAEYEQHTASIPADGDPDSDWWYGKWAETILPVIKDVLKDGSS